MAGGLRVRSVLIIGGILIVALGLRIGEVQRTSYKLRYDSPTYLHLASQVARTGDFSTGHAPGVGAGGSRGPSAYFPPAYPYVLALVDLIDGHKVRADGAVHPARLANAVLGTGIVLLTGVVGLEVFGELVGLIALVLATVYPVFIELSAILVAENLFTLLVLAAVWAMLRAARSAHPYRWIGAAGILTGLATLTHVNGVVLIFPLALAAWRLQRTVSAELRRPVAGPALLVGLTALTIAPWTIRNEVELHRFIAVSDEAGITLVGTYNRASAANHAVPYKWRIYYGIPGERALVREARHLSEPALSGKLESQALDYIGAHPLSPAAVLFHNGLRLLELEGSRAWGASAAALDIPQPTARVGVISFWLLGLLALAGALTRAARAAPVWLWVVPVLLWLSAAAVNAETPRFREPVDPFLILLAACGLATVVRAATVRLRRAAPPGGGHGSAVAGRPGQLVEMVERLA